jgi:predicted Zn-dependent protease
VAPPEPARVLELFRQTEKFHPRSPYPCELVGDFLLQAGETEGAVIFSKRSRSYVPGRPAVYRRLALAACERNDFEAARNYLAEAGKRFPADPKNQEKRFFEEWKRRKQGKKL